MKLHKKNRRNELKSLKPNFNQGGLNVILSSYLTVRKRTIKMNNER